MRCPERCPDCPSRKLPPWAAHEAKQVIPGDGPLNARVVFVGEAPGREENSRGRPFVGSSGREFNEHYLPLAGLNRDSVYVTNAVKCHWADAHDAPPPSLIKSCSEFHLRRELEEIRPQYVVLMGAIANSLIEPQPNLEMDHGIPLTVKVLGHPCIVVPFWHPAYGLHQSDMMGDLIDDFKLLGQLINNGDVPSWWRFGMDMPNLLFQRLTKWQDVERVVMNKFHVPLAVDTESMRISRYRYKPWCLTFALEPEKRERINYKQERVTKEWCHAGYMIRADDHEAIECFAHYYSKFSMYIMHHSKHDIPVLDDMGLMATERWHRVQDTMVRAYNLATLPQGLKALCWRLMGMKMKDFTDVVRPYSDELIWDFMGRAQWLEYEKPAPVPTGKHKEINCPECKGKKEVPVYPRSKKKIKCLRCKGVGKIHKGKFSQSWGPNQYLNRALGDWLKDNSVDLLDRWSNWPVKQTVQVEKVMGESFPWPSIHHVPENEALEYACTDAIGTWRLYMWELKRRATTLRKRVR